MAWRLFWINFRIDCQWKCIFPKLIRPNKYDLGGLTTISTSVQKILKSFSNALVVQTPYVWQYLIISPILRSSIYCLSLLVFLQQMNRVQVFQTRNNSEPSKKFYKFNEILHEKVKFIAYNRCMFLMKYFFRRPFKILTVYKYRSKELWSHNTVIQSHCGSNLLENFSKK